MINTIIFWSFAALIITAALFSTACIIGVVHYQLFHTDIWYAKYLDNLYLDRFFS